MFTYMLNSLDEEEKRKAQLVICLFKKICIESLLCTRHHPKYQGCRHILFSDFMGNLGVIRKKKNLKLGETFIER